jgi:hypothetical protein
LPKPNQPTTNEPSGKNTTPRDRARERERERKREREREREREGESAASRRMIIEWGGGGEKGSFTS